MLKEQKDGFLKKKPVIGKGQQISMQQLEAHLAKTRRDFKREALWSQIMHIAKEVVLYMAQAPAITRHGKFMPGQFFDIFGLDLMLDTRLKVWMCEVNNSPGLDDQDKRVFGQVNPDYQKEHKCFLHLWNDFLALLGLDAQQQHPMGTLRHWYEIDFSDKSA